MSHVTSLMDFVVDVPANGEFVLIVSKDGYNSSDLPLTRWRSEDMIKDNFKPVLKLEGVTMSKPLPGIDYSALSQNLIR